MLSDLIAVALEIGSAELNFHFIATEYDFLYVGYW